MKENVDMTKEKIENALIEQAFQELLNDYLATKHRKRIEIITKAFNFANQAHKGIKRRSGEPYIMHPLAVAKIVCNEIGLGSTSICAALLHDVVEDTDYTVEDISNIFGPKIAQIVDGLTKISGGIFGDRASAQAENFKKLLLTMSDDIRVILIKIADRLHNMRTLGSMMPNKQYKIAGETLYIYAPLANRLGLYKIKTELENLSFKYEHPEKYNEIEDKLAATAPERDKVFQEFTAPIRTQLDRMGLKYRILARVKSIYSIWNKMQTKHVPFEEIYDILAVRIIFEPQNIEEELNDCFDIYVSICKIYKPHPDRLRDWLSHPKSNGYQALHVTLMGNHGQWIEVQIRSERMNDVAEQGFAAHWKYKEGGGSEDEGELDKWLHTIKEILDDPQPDAIDFLDTIKLNLFASEIFVFTPKGEIRTMPQGCTALDFAFSLHTDLGSHCIGAKVNHKLVPLSHKLQSGDQVEILTSKAQRVQPEWETFVTTARAHNKISSILRKEAKNYQKKGEIILEEFCKKEEIPFNESNIEKIRKSRNFKNREELMLAIGTKKYIPGDYEKNLFKSKQKGGWKKLIPFAFGNKEHEEKEEKNELPKEKINTKEILKLTEEGIKKKHTMADCCHPIPGDDVLGYIDDEGRIIIHKRQCAVAARLKSSYGNRIIATQWDTHKELSFLVTIYIKGIDCVGLLNEVTQIISGQLNVNIRKLDIETIDGIFDGRIQLYVHDVEDVRRICSNLKNIENIKQVTRIEE
ncbi:MAG: bifunctional (p)ppGpp synthetase/guanosine-3',5'-bis(diphosphate) 3'-pyrophosphohydrolase [Mediterranea massiliensis]|nr:bifunctional (p)ppGpp synthetase/guanosine-3',5'-bis(diphosphate) 3'-pyrophosphohydrolase [Mediterranea massiliensis]